MKPFVITLFILNVLTVNANMVLQAENGTFDGRTDTQHAGFTGTGFVDFTNRIGSFLQIDFSLAEAMPNATVLVRWANGKNDDRDMRFTVNDVVQISSQPFGSSGAFTSWVETPVVLSLRQGTNRLLITSLTANGGPNMDRLTIVGGSQGVREIALNVVVRGKGTVLKNPDAPFYPEGTLVQLQAVPDLAFGSTFVGWSGDVVNSHLQTSIVMNGPKTVTATFQSSVYATYYCAPIEKGGNDLNPGTKEAPFFNVSKALTVMEPGDTLYLRGGTYRYTATILMNQKGSALEYFHIFNYPGERPVLNFYDIFSSYVNLNATARGQARGFLITGDYYHLKGLEICQAPDNGIKIEGSFNICELLVLHHNGDSGLQIGLAKDSPDAPDKVANNLVINCDSYRNLDWGTGYENADGFACKLSAGANNRFVGCRAWENADDGWDFYMTRYTIYVDSCWTFGNGNAALATVSDLEWEYAQKNPLPTGWAGDGNGFKLGGDGWAAKHVVRNSIAFDGFVTGAGFNENNNADSLFLFNCVAWQNMKNFRIRAHPSDLRNCISFDAKVGGEGQMFDLAAGTVQMNNSWNSIQGQWPLVPNRDQSNRSFDQKAIYNQFVSTSKSDFLAPREPCGGLPRNGFGRLRENSIFIDRGTNVVRGVDPVTWRQTDIPLTHFHGQAADLGAFEFVPASVTQLLPLFTRSTHLQVYPNPFFESTTIEVIALAQGIAHLQITDITGRTVWQTTFHQLMVGEKRSVRVHSLEGKGVYLAHFVSGNQRITTKLIRVKL